MKLSRKDLYEQVWSKPITELAKEHGFSDNGFAKICRRHKIPLPPRGYWAKKAAGLNVPKISLPAKNENLMVYIESRKPISNQDLLNKKAKLAHEKSEIEEIGVIKLPSELSNPHKFTINTKAHFEKMIKKIKVAKASKSLPKNLYDFYNLMPRGRIECFHNNCYKITVSESLVDRALIFMDTLVKELELRGFNIQPNKEDKLASSIVAYKGEDRITFQISEGYKFQLLDKKSKDLSALEQWLYSDKEPVPTGRLTFSVHTVESHIGRNWSDSKRPIEEILPTIIYEFTRLIPRLTEYRAKEEEKQKQYLMDLEAFREKEAQRYREISLYEEALKEAKAFNDYIKIESYLKSLKKKLIEQNGTLSDTAQSWISEVTMAASKQNPLPKRLIKLML